MMTAQLALAGDTALHPIPFAKAAAAPRAFPDPLDKDLPNDDVVVTTRRAISRVALVATETACRFQREGMAHDAMTWMLAPRVLFAGASALEACLDRDACLRGVLLHGLSLGLDADPAAIDALTDDDVDEVDDSEGIDFSRVEFKGRSRGAGRSSARQARAGEDLSDDGEDHDGPGRQCVGGEPRLFTATVVADDGFETVHAFHASLAMDEDEVAGRLYRRMGAASADAAIVRGFDHTSPMVEALVSQALCDTLRMVDADPRSPLAAGLDLNVEQRFHG